MARTRKKNIEVANSVVSERVVDTPIDSGLSIISSDRKPVRKKPPKEFKIGRALMTTQNSVEQQLFDILEAKDNRNYTISGVTKSITPKLLHQTIFALGQVLSNTSYQYGNEKDHTGMAVDGKISKGSIKPMDIKETSEEGSLIEKQYHYAEVKTSLRELAKFAFGTDEPNHQQRLDIEKALYAFQNEGVQLTINGKTYTKSLVWIEGWTSRENENDLKEVYLVLNPIFAMNAAKSYAKHPQDASKRLSNAVRQVTIAHLKLRDLLAMQQVKKEPFRRYASELLEYLGLTDEYKKNPKRVMETKLPNLFKAMVDIKLLNDMPTKETGIKGELEFVFNINKNYSKPIKE